jgi:hypothetical protein
MSGDHVGENPRDEKQHLVSPRQHASGLIHVSIITLVPTTVLVVRVEHSGTEALLERMQHVVNQRAISVSLAFSCSWSSLVVSRLIVSRLIARANKSCAHLSS